MDNIQIIKNINQVILALNTIDVRGKANLANLSGSISVLEDVLNELLKEKQEEQEEQEKQEKQKK